MSKTKRTVSFNSANLVCLETYGDRNDILHQDFGFEADEESWKEKYSRYNDENQSDYMESQWHNVGHNECAFWKH